MNNAGIESRNLTLNLNGCNSLIIPHFLCLPSETVCIVGANGSGKSLLLECLCGLYRYRGIIEYFQTPNNLKREKLSLSNLKISAMLQRFNLWESARVSEIISVIEAIANSSFEKDDFLADITNRKFRNLSVGEKQYLLFTLFFSFPSNIYIFDEPAMGLDATLYKKVLAKVKNNKKTQIVVLHNFADVLACADKCYFMCKGYSINLTILKTDTISSDATVELFRTNGSMTNNKDLLFSKDIKIEDSRSAELLNGEIMPFVNNSIKDKYVNPFYIILKIRSGLYGSITKLYT